MTSNELYTLAKGIFKMELTKAIKDINIINEILYVYPKYDKNDLLNTGLHMSDTLNV